VTPPVPALTLAEVARAYKALAAQPDDLGRLAREAYPILFGLELPDLTSIARPKSWVERVQTQLQHASYTLATWISDFTSR